MGLIINGEQTNSSASFTSLCKRPRSKDARMAGMMKEARDTGGGLTASIQAQET